MTPVFATAQLAAQRHENRIAEATKYRQTRTFRAKRVPHTRWRNGSARQIAAEIRSACRAWYSAGEL